MSEFSESRCRSGFRFAQSGLTVELLRRGGFKGAV